jgi:hypothetical protein
MKKKHFFYTISFVLLFITGLFLYQLLMVNKKNYASSKPEIFIESVKLSNAYSNNEKKADKLYTNKLIEVHGSIKEITYLNNRTTIILNGNDNSSGIICDINKSQNKKLAGLQKNQKIHIKGICKGFLKDVVFLNCYIDTKKTNE